MSYLHECAAFFMNTANYNSTIISENVAQLSGYTSKEFVSFLLTGLTLAAIADSAFYTISGNNLKKAIFGHLEIIAKSNAYIIDTFLEIQKERIMQISQGIVFENFLRTNQQDPDYMDKFRCHRHSSQARVTLCYRAV